MVVSAATSLHSFEAFKKEFNSWMLLKAEIGYEASDK